MTKIEQVYAAAKRILEGAPDGMRFSDLIRAVEATGLEASGLPQYIQWLVERNPETFYKPSRGIFALTSQIISSPKDSIRSGTNGTGTPDAGDSTTSDVQQLREQAFYQTFADYLVNDLDECTRAVPLGGNAFGGKWGTPDVIGVTLPRPRDIYKAPVEVVSAEIKVIAGKELITAFGQACSYQLFSHKSYIVVPNDARNIDLDRLETLCQSFGIGLVVFNASSPENPDYRIRVRASRREPDRFYINEALAHTFFDGLLGNTLPIG